MLRRAFVLAVAVLGLVGATALGGTLRVPAAYPTLQAAVDAAGPNDVILVAPGIYEETITIRDKNDLTIIGDVDLDLPDAYACAPPIEDDVAAVAIRGPVYIVNSTNITLEKLMIAGSGVLIQGSAGSPVDGVTIRYCAIVRNAGDGIRLVGHYTNVRVIGSIVSFNGDHGINVRDYGKGILIENCNVNDNGRTNPRASGILVGPYIEDLVVRDNCILRNPFAAVHPA